ncbi:MAG: universal stress protein [Dehalococcoidales bacterium]|nr:universal stress protein [Dehalococcoidales bacterium]
MFQRILVPLDGSRLSTQAVPFAVEIAKRFSAEVVLVRVLAPSSVTTVLQSNGKKTNGTDDIIAQEVPFKDVDNVANAKRYLVNWSQSIKSQGVKSSYQVTVGTPAKSIMDLADSQGISLIVMMSHGRGWFKRAIMGSVADAILRGSKVPVLVVRPKTAEGK